MHRHLLFAALAVKKGFVSSGDLAAGLNVWLQQPDRPLAGVLWLRPAWQLPPWVPEPLLAGTPQVTTPYLQVPIAHPHATRRVARSSATEHRAHEVRSPSSPYLSV